MARRLHDRAMRRSTPKTRSPPDSETIDYELAGSSAVFRGKYKLVRNPREGAWELFDMVADPSEVHDLAKEKPALVAALTAAYAGYEKENRVVPVPVGYNPVEQVVKNSKRHAH